MRLIWNVFIKLRLNFVYLSSTIGLINQSKNFNFDFEYTIDFQDNCLFEKDMDNCGNGDNLKAISGIFEFTFFINR